MFENLHDDGPAEPGDPDDMPAYVETVGGSFVPVDKATPDQLRAYADSMTLSANAALADAAKLYALADRGGWGNLQ